VLAPVAALASWQDILDRVQPTTAEGNAVVGFDRAPVIGAVCAATVVLHQQRKPIVDSDELPT
jgi:hypothetical protein